MAQNIPTGKFKRTVASGKIAARMGKKQVGFWVKNSFASRKKKEAARKQRDQETAEILFQGLSMLKGTALKAAQVLSFETGLFPEAIRKELEKSYHQVPPINRALIRRIFWNNFNAFPETVFRSFDGTAFAAASLGQVHPAESQSGECLAVKVQYPDIAQTIVSDIRILKSVCYPMAEYDIIKTALEEIETVLLDETDYEKEAANIRFFKKHLTHPDLRIPDIIPDLCSRQVLTMTRMKGVPLDRWLASRPPQKLRNRVARILNEIFVKGFYELKCIHADPNPGNFLISETGTVSLLDFGCIRKFDDRFVGLYQCLVRLGGSRNRDDFTDLLTEMGMLEPDMTDPVQSRILDLFMEMGDWYGRLFAQDLFDFGKHPDFMEKGRRIGQQAYRLRKQIPRINPEFIFLDRTRYGLIRLIEIMEATVPMRNRYEFTRDNPSC